MLGYDIVYVNFSSKIARSFLYMEIIRYLCIQLVLKS